jgi:hypothetical protein
MGFGSLGQVAEYQDGAMWEERSEEKCQFLPRKFLSFNEHVSVNIERTPVETCLVFKPDELVIFRTA